MRTLGILAIFVLALCAIGEGAYLVKLSRRIDVLSRPTAESAEEPALTPRTTATRPAAPRREPARTLPAFVSTPPPSSSAPVVTLHDALATPEGREQLKAALAHIEEEKRQDSLVSRADRNEGREARFKERITKGLTLNGEETHKLAALFTNLQTQRRHVLEEMKAGQRTSRQADDEIDKLEDGSEEQVKAMLGEERMKKLRDLERQDRDNRRRGDQAPAVAAKP